MIHVLDLSIEIDGRELLSDVSAVFGTGELSVVLGPNGAGKSTLMGALAGESAPARGEILFARRRLSTIPRAELARRRAVLPQASSLTASYTVEEVVAFGRLPHLRWSTRRRDAAVVDEVMETTGVSELAARDYPDLSEDEKLRVQLGRVLAQIWDGEGERALLLDEPTAALGLHHQKAVLKLARRLSRRGLTVVAALQDPGLAAEHADHLILLDGGRLAAAGVPEDVLTERVLRRMFRAPVTLLEQPAVGRPLPPSLIAEPAFAPRARTSSSSGARQ
ncbi:MAG: heme ABC transporter ATP-binding protein [Acidobacteriota bacterium]